MTTDVKPCRACGATERNSNGLCVPCKRRRHDKWQAKNADEERARKRAYYEANRQTVIARAAAWAVENADRRRTFLQGWNAANAERVRGYSLAWRLRHPEKRRQSVREWSRRNQASINLRQHARRAGMCGQHLSRDIRSKLHRLQRGRCACCGLPLGRDYEVDHVMPIARGGTNTDDNVQLLRAQCNRKKSSRHPVDYMQSKGKLL